MYLLLVSLFFQQPIKDSNFYQVQQRLHSLLHSLRAHKNPTALTMYTYHKTNSLHCLQANNPNTKYCHHYNINKSKKSSNNSLSMSMNPSLSSESPYLISRFFPRYLLRMFKKKIFIQINSRSFHHNSNLILNNKAHK